MCSNISEHVKMCTCQLLGELFKKLLFMSPVTLTAANQILSTYFEIRSDLYLLMTPVLCPCFLNKADKVGERELPDQVGRAVFLSAACWASTLTGSISQHQVQMISQTLDLSLYISKYVPNFRGC